MGFWNGRFKARSEQATVHLGRRGESVWVCQRCTAQRQLYLLKCGMPNQVIKYDFTNTENDRLEWMWRYKRNKRNYEPTSLFSHSNLPEKNILETAIESIRVEIHSVFKLPHHIRSICYDRQLNKAKKKSCVWKTISTLTCHPNTKITYGNHYQRLQLMWRVCLLFFALKTRFGKYVNAIQGSVNSEWGGGLIVSTGLQATTKSPLPPVRHSCMYVCHDGLHSTPDRFSLTQLDRSRHGNLTVLRFG